jgi:protein-L-isoaspartate(D-aspartate) O-methyltransferase
VLGWPLESPFDAIAVAAATPRLPRILLAQLAEGGRMVAPVGSPELQHLIRVTRRGNDLEREDLGACRFVPLIAPEAWSDSAAARWPRHEPPAGNGAGLGSVDTDDPTHDCP